MSCRHPRRGALEILLAGSSAPCHPVVVVAKGFTISTAWDVAGCWSQCPGTGSHLRVLLGPQALWRLTRRACLQRLHLGHCTWHSQTEGRTPVLLTLGCLASCHHTWTSTFGWNGCPNWDENQMRESDIEKPNKRTVCNKRLLNKKNNWKRQSGIPTAIPATMLCKTSATPERQRPSASAAHGTVWWGQQERTLLSEMTPLMPREAATSAHSFPAVPAWPKT